MTVAKSHLDWWRDPAEVARLGGPVMSAVMETARVPGDWYRDSREIARLLRHLHDQEGIDVTICIDICEKPWHWTAEYEEMLRHDLEQDAKQGRFDYVRGA